MTTTATTPTLPAWAEPLPAGALACYRCGVLVPAGEGSGEPLTLNAAAHPAHPLDPTRGWVPGRPYTFATCTACADRDRLSADTLTRLPKLARQLGGSETARRRLAAVLDAVAASVLDVQTTADGLTEASGAALVHYLAEPAGSVRFLGQFVPTTGPGTVPDTHAREPWQHLSDPANAATGGALRRGLTAFLAERRAQHAPPLDVPPPEGRGCLLCGVSHVSLPAERAARLGGPDAARAMSWRALSVNLSVLGGPGSSAPTSGAVCPTCSEALDRTGAVGLPAVEAAWLAYLEAHGHADAARLLTWSRGADGGQLRGVLAWAALVAQRRRAGQPEPEPSSEPWAHLAVPTAADLAGGADDERR